MRALLIPVSHEPSGLPPYHEALSLAGVMIFDPRPTSGGPPHLDGDELGRYAVAILDSGGLGDALGCVMADLRSERPDLPLISVSSDPGREDCVRALELGADDWMAAPPEPRELASRIRAIVRRARTAPRLGVGDLRIDLARRKVERGERELDLSPREYDVLLALASAEGRLLSKPELLERVWGSSSSPGTSVVEVQIARLRRKIDARGSALIHTEPRRGYRLSSVHVLDLADAAHGGEPRPDAACDFAIDGEDRVVEVAGAWDGLETGARDEVSAARILGRSLWEFVRGEALRALYRGIANVVRSHPEEFRILGMCSAPEEERAMELSVRGGRAAGHVAFRSRLWALPGTSSPNGQAGARCPMCETSSTNGSAGDLCNACIERAQRAGLLVDGRRLSGS